MEMDEAIRLRVSCRSYGSAKVDDGVVRELIELAMQAPSAGNTEEWIFVVVKDQKSRQAIGDACFGRTFIASAPVVVVVCADMDKIEQAYGERGVSLYAAQDVATAVENFMLAATGRGLATCWIGAFNEQAVRNAINAPSHVRPMAMITLGYAKDKPKKPGRMPVSDVAFAELYGKPFK